jgi:hypothetical protein
MAGQFTRIMEMNELKEQEKVGVDMKAMRRTKRTICRWDSRLPGGSQSSGMAKCDTAKSASKSQVEWHLWVATFTAAVITGDVECF